MPSVYLAGPISGLTWEQATLWRRKATERLADVGITAFSPLRHKLYLSEETSLGDTYPNYPLSTQRGIVCRDYRDVRETDCLIANFKDATKVSSGTVMEIAWAYAHRKPVICILDTWHAHAMIRECVDYFAQDIDEAIHFARSILCPA